MSTERRVVRSLVIRWPGHHDNVYVAAARLGYARIEVEQPYAELGVR